MLSFSMDCLDWSYGLAVGLSVSMTFIGTSVLSSLIILLLTYMCMRGRDKKATSTGSAPLYDIPSANAGKESLKMSPCAAYGRVHSRPTVPSSSAYETVALQASDSIKACILCERNQPLLTDIDCACHTCSAQQMTMSANAFTTPDIPQIGKFSPVKNFCRLLRWRKLNARKFFNGEQYQSTHVCQLLLYRNGVVSLLRCFATALVQRLHVREL